MAYFVPPFEQFLIGVTPSVKDENGTVLKGAYYSSIYDYPWPRE